nr:anhydro-N-acetylmuramic acid kinase [Pseudomonas sp.]
MSGTSLDAIDGVLAEFSPSGTHPQTLAHASVALPAVLREELLALNTSSHDELHRAAQVANALADLSAQVVDTLLRAAPQLARHDVMAIGSHGQTVRHQPQAGYTLQLNAPARLAENTGIAVVADFRSRDVAAGGQGAPLVPAFHQAVFGASVPRVVLNLGGIANISVLPPGGAVTGFDTGPANVLLDLWCRRHTGQSYDIGGQFAAAGRVRPALLDFLLASEPWLGAPPPKSTGRDLFHAAWLDTRLQDFTARAGTALSAADVQATLVAFTARTVADAVSAGMAVHGHAGGHGEMYVCGGGAANPVLMKALADCLPGYVVQTTDVLGVPAQQVEALAFAWLAHAHVQRLPGNLPAVTGARGPRILGAYYPA